MRNFSDFYVNAVLNAHAVFVFVLLPVSLVLVFAHLAAGPLGLAAACCLICISLAVGARMEQERVNRGNRG